MRRHPAAAALAAILLLTACGGTDEDAADQAPDPPDAEAPVEADPDPADDPTDDAADDPAADAGDDAAGSDALLGPQVQTAIDDVVERTGAAREDVLVTVTELVTWPDGSLGCPEPDTMYTQALVDGYRIVLEVDGEPFAYHGVHGEDVGEPLYCADPQPPAE